MQIYLRDPNQSIRAVARQSGCNPSLLSRNLQFRRLRQAYQSKLPKGSKAKDGTLEAESNDTD
jgi:hypothetical protein